MSLGKAISSVKYELLVLLALFTYATYYYLEVSALSGRKTNLLMIGPVYWALLVCIVALAASKIIEALKSAEPQASDQLNQPSQNSIRLFVRNAIAFSLSTVVYVLLLDRVGFVTTSFLYLSCLTFLLGARSIWLVIVLPASVVGFLYVTMSIFLRFRLPEGLLI